jgi:hypothetical protein
MEGTVKSTVIVTRDNFDQRFPDDDRERFWTLVRKTLQAFKADPKQADEYRRGLENARPGERIAVYHTSPLSIAADLAGRPLSEPIPAEVLRQYLELQRIYLRESELQ